MDCHHAHARILEGFDDGAALEADATLTRHLAGCADCSAFARLHATLDAQLVRALAAPSLSGAFRPALRARIDKEPRASRVDGLLDLVHFASCALATLVLTMILPIDAAAVVAAGMTVALTSYVALSIVRGSFEDEFLESEP